MPVVQGALRAKRGGCGGARLHAVFALCVHFQSPANLHGKANTEKQPHEHTMMMGENVLGVAVFLVEGHPQLASDHPYTIVGYDRDGPGLLIDTTPPHAASAPAPLSHSWFNHFFASFGFCPFPSHKWKAESGVAVSAILFHSP